MFSHLIVERGPIAADGAVAAATFADLVMERGNGRRLGFEITSCKL